VGGRCCGGWGSGYSRPRTCVWYNKFGPAGLTRCGGPVRPQGREGTYGCSLRCPECDGAFALLTAGRRQAEGGQPAQEGQPPHDPEPPHRASSVQEKTMSQPAGPDPARRWTPATGHPRCPWLSHTTDHRTPVDHHGWPVGPDHLATLTVLCACRTPPWIGYTSMITWRLIALLVKIAASPGCARAAVVVVRPMPPSEWCGGGGDALTAWPGTTTAAGRTDPRL
jgi:hypothetical protein